MCPHIWGRTSTSHNQAFGMFLGQLLYVLPCNSRASLNFLPVFYLTLLFWDESGPRSKTTSQMSFPEGAPVCQDLRVELRLGWVLTCMLKLVPPELWKWSIKSLDFLTQSVLFVCLFSTSCFTLLFEFSSPFCSNLRCFSAILYIACLCVCACVLCACQ